ncbi:MAG: hypothetical protein U5L45_05775 [Saprospiraceae bacterium]|nr:hypothetical protein [Saprospiraceae bacterium]
MTEKSTIFLSKHARPDRFLTVYLENVVHFSGFARKMNHLSSFASEASNRPKY